MGAWGGFISGLDRLAQIVSQLAGIVGTLACIITIAALLFVGDHSSGYVTATDRNMRQLWTYVTNTVYAQCASTDKTTNIGDWLNWQICFTNSILKLTSRTSPWSIVIWLLTLPVAIGFHLACYIVAVTLHQPAAITELATCATLVFVYILVQIVPTYIIRQVANATVSRKSKYN
jgi:hypothetical protein